MTENKMNPGLFEELLSARNNTAPYCTFRDTSQTAYLLSEIKTMQEIFQNLFSTNFEENACQRTDSETCNKIQAFLKSGQGLLALGQLDSAEAQAKEIITNFEARTLKIYNQLEGDEHLIRVNPDLIKKVKPSRRKFVQNAIQELDANDKAFEVEIEPLFRKLEPIFKNPKIFDSISELWPCFSSPKMEGDFWMIIADQYKDLLLSDQDIKDAQKCESEFSFQ